MEYLQSIDHIADIPSVAWHPNNHLLSDVIGTKINNQREVNIYEIPSGKLVNTFKSASKPIQSSLWSRNGEKLVATTWDDQVQIWNAKTNKFIENVGLPSGGPTYIRGLNDDLVGSYCNSTEGLCTLWILNTTSLKWGEPFEKNTIDDFLIYGAMQPSPNGHLLASDGVQGKVFIFNMSTGKIEHEFGAHTGFVTSISWSLTIAKNWLQVEATVSLICGTSHRQTNRITHFIN